MSTNRNLQIWTTEEFTAAVLEIVRRTRFYIGEKKSAPYARAARDVLILRGIKAPDELYSLISREAI